MTLWSKSKDMYFYTNYYIEHDEKQPYFLKDGDLKFRISIVDENLDILDNPYGEIKLHRYTNLEDANNIQEAQPTD